VIAPVTGSTGCLGRSIITILVPDRPAVHPIRCRLRPLAPYISVHLPSVARMVALDRQVQEQDVFLTDIQ
jgi:hypothetical protein